VKWKKHASPLQVIHICFYLLQFMHHLFAPSTLLWVLSKYRSNNLRNSWPAIPARNREVLTLAPERLTRSVACCFEHELNTQHSSQPVYLSSLVTIAETRPAIIPQWNHSTKPSANYSKNPGTQI
jgi:hypothetical protein